MSIEHTADDVGADFAHFLTSLWSSITEPPQRTTHADTPASPPPLSPAQMEEMLSRLLSRQASGPVVHTVTPEALRAALSNLTVHAVGSGDETTTRVIHDVVERPVVQHVIDRQIVHVPETTVVNNTVNNVTSTHVREGDTVIDNHTTTVVQAGGSVQIDQTIAHTTVTAGNGGTAMNGAGGHPDDHAAGHGAGDLGHDVDAHSDPNGGLSRADVRAGNVAHGDDGSAHGDAHDPSHPVEVHPDPHDDAHAGSASADPASADPGHATADAHGTDVHTTDAHAPDRSAGDHGAADPGHGADTGAGAHVDTHAADPHQSHSSPAPDADHTAHHDPDPHALDEHPDLHTVDTHVVDAHTVDPHAVDPHAVDAHVSDPHAVDLAHH